MAVFKTLNAKKKEYVFDFLGNRSDPKPAKAVFSRFPLPDENFIPGEGGIFDGIDLEKIIRRDTGELEKLSKALVSHLTANAHRVDLKAFLHECIDRFEDFTFVNEDGKKCEIKTVDDFLLINGQVMTSIAFDCYRYARQEDEFSMGE